MLFLCLVAFSIHADFNALKPISKNIVLEPYTKMVVELVPDFGTRFNFPFILDEGDNIIPYSFYSTNPVFKALHKPGHSFFLLEINPPEEGGELPLNLGNIFITAGGYHISMIVKSTTDVRKNVSDYVFSLSERDSEDLIQTSVKKRSAALERSFKEKEAGLEQRANELALKKIAMLSMQEPDNSNIKEDVTLELPQGQEITVYMSDMSTYGKKFHVIHYEVTNDTAEVLRILDVSLFTIDKNDIKTKISSVNHIKERIIIDKTEEGWVVSDSILITEGANLMLAVLTSEGEIDVKW